MVRALMRRAMQYLALLLLFVIAETVIAVLAYVRRDDIPSYLHSLWTSSSVETLNAIEHALKCCGFFNRTDGVAPGNVCYNATGDVALYADGCYTLIHSEFVKNIVIVEACGFGAAGIEAIGIALSIALVVSLRRRLRTSEQTWLLSDGNSDSRYAGTAGAAAAGRALTSATAQEQRERLSHAAGRLGPSAEARAIRRPGERVSGPATRRAQWARWRPQTCTCADTPLPWSP